MQDRIGLVERAGDLDGPGGAGALREQPQMGALDVHVAQRLALAGSSDRPLAVGDRQCARFVGRQLRRAVGRQVLHVALRAAEAPGPVHLRRAEPDRPAGAEGRLALHELRDRPRAVAQRVVDLAAKLRADRHVDADRHDQHDERHGEARGPGDTAAQRHGSRRT